MLTCIACNISNENGNRGLIYTRTANFNSEYSNFVDCDNATIMLFLFNSTGNFQNLIIHSLLTKKEFMSFYGTFASFNNCSIISFGNISIFKTIPSDITFKNCILQIDNINDLNISFEFNTIVDHQTNVDYIHLYDIECYTVANVNYELVTGKQDSRYTQGREFTILMREAVFQDLNDDYKGGSFRINEELVTLIAVKCIFVNSTSHFGGAFYIDSILQININNTCFSCCNALYAPLFVINNQYYTMESESTSFFLNPRISYNQIFTITTDLSHHYIFQFEYCNFSHNSLLRKESFTPIISAPQVIFLYVFYESQEAERSHIHSVDYTAVDNSIFFNNTVHFNGFFISSKHISYLSNSVFIQNNFPVNELEYSSFNWVY